MCFDENTTLPDSAIESGSIVYIVQLITPSVPAMAVSTVIRILRISFQLIRMVFGLKVNNFVVELRQRSQCD